MIFFFFGGGGEKETQTHNLYFRRQNGDVDVPWRRGLLVSSPPANEQAGAMGRDIESRQGMHRVVAFILKMFIWTLKRNLCRNKC
jgi:hypothetical protein